MCGYLNLKPPMNKSAFIKMQKTIALAYKTVAEKFMNQASTEILNDDQIVLNNKGIANITVSCDGTWQRRGYASLNGVVTVI